VEAKWYCHLCHLASNSNVTSDSQGQTLRISQDLLKPGPGSVVLAEPKNPGPNRTDSVWYKLFSGQSLKVHSFSSQDLLKRV